MNDCMTFYERFVPTKINKTEWAAYCREMPCHYRKFPVHWDLNHHEASLLLDRMQSWFFNPDNSDQPEEKRSILNLFVQFFLEPETINVYHFLKARHTEENQMRWELRLAKFENLKQLISMSGKHQVRWLYTYDTKFRQPFIRTRAKVIKTKGLGLSCPILNVTPTMTWKQIKTKYRELLKIHHPDFGGSQQTTQELINAFEKLKSNVKEL